jgi:retron-type reverse transcriptase
VKTLDAQPRRTRLGIPTVRDRVVQQACKLVIEPIFEANFLPCSYGYRPKRSAGQAVRAVKEALVRRWWVVDADIEGYFDNVDHEILMGLCRRRISDRRVLKLIDQWLRAGVMIEGHRHETRRGVPQGGGDQPLPGQHLPAHAGQMVERSSRGHRATPPVLR